MTGEIFSSLHYGVLIHFSLASTAARGESALSNGAMSTDEMRVLAGKFKPYHFDACKICDFARRNGMKYIIFTSMLGDGFRMYDSTRSEFNSVNLCGRDFCYEMMTAARKQGMKFGLYHALYDSSSEALSENERVANICEELSEVLRRYPDVEILRCDWQTAEYMPETIEKVTAMLQRIKPGLIFMPLTGEKRISLNEHWGYHGGDQQWKSPQEIIRHLLALSQQKCNLLLNFALDGNGNMPADGAKIIRKVGKWLKAGGSALLDAAVKTDEFTLPDGDGEFYRCGEAWYFVMQFVPGKIWRAGKLPFEIAKVVWDGKKLAFRQSDGLAEIKLPSKLRSSLVPVIKICPSCK